MDWTKDRVERIFGYYGTIRQIEKIYLQATDVNNCLYTGKDNGDQNRIEIY